MQATILTAPPQARQVSMSMPKNALEALCRNPVIAALPSGVIMYEFAQRYQVAIATATTTVLVYTALSTITLSGLLLILVSP